MQEFKSIRDLVQNSRYIVFATVNEDGTPHNSPIFYIPSESLDKIYMGTHPESLHATNIIRTGEAFGVIFGQTPEGGRGVYFKINNFHEVSDDEIVHALKAHNKARAKLGKQAIPMEYYKKPNQQRMYVGDVIEVSVNDTIRDNEGKLIQDIRQVISPEELID